LGRAVTLVGISAGLSALSACGDKAKEVKEVEKDSLTVGKVVTESDTHLTGDIDYRSPEDCVIVEKRQPTAKIRTAKFKASPKKEEVDTAYTEVMKGAVDVIPVGQVPEEIFGDVVEQMPSFPGGTQALFDYLKENMHYPEDCEETCVQGRVVVSFVVERDGSITESKVVKSVYPSLDEEALRVVNGMPKWFPGKQNGKSVRTKYTIPVSFKLQ
jgi:protein TonB